MQRLAINVVRRTVCGLVLVCSTTTLAATDKPSEVQDLAYGEVLFEFFQENYFDAISRVQRAQVNQELDYHANEAALLEGGMSLAYGMERAATRIFDELLTDAVKPDVRNRAWYYLARVAHQKGRPDDAAAALARIDGKTKHALQPEQTMLLGHVLLSQGDAAGAVQAFSNWKGPAEDRPYAIYNHGIALLRAGDTEAGFKLLDKLGDKSVSSGELYALRDKTNLALGYRLLQQEESARARPYFNRVRLDGPLSNRALLGAGWADAQQERFQEALVPWLELRDRDGRDLAVQESWLAVPYAYAQLGADGRAVELYQDAIRSFLQESRELQEAIAALAEGRLIDTLHNADGSGRSWFWQLAQLPDTPETRYLVEMLAGHRFQEAVKNLRDLKDLSDRLADWSESMQTFDHMIETRRLRFTEHEPTLRDDLQRLDVDALQARQQQLKRELQRIEREDDPIGLMTETERRHWDQLALIGERLDKLPDNARTQLMREKQVRLRGLLLWQVDNEFKARLRSASKQLDDLDTPLLNASALAERGRSAFVAAPTTFKGYDGRIAGLRDRVIKTQSRVDAALARQGQLITQLAQAELQTRKRRVDTYLVQARFALAQTYDKAGLTPPGTVGGEQR